MASIRIEGKDYDLGMLAKAPTNCWNELEDEAGIWTDSILAVPGAPAVSLSRKVAAMAFVILRMQGRRVSFDEAGAMVSLDSLQGDDEPAQEAPAEPDPTA